MGKFDFWETAVQSKLTIQSTIAITKKCNLITIKLTDDEHCLQVAINGLLLIIYDQGQPQIASIHKSLSMGFH